MQAHVILSGCASARQRWTHEGRQRWAAWVIFVQNSCPELTPCPKPCGSIFWTGRRKVYGRDWFRTQCQLDGQQISDRVVDEGSAQAVALVKQHAGGQHDSLMQGVARSPSALGPGIDRGNAQANAIRLGLAAKLPRRCRRVFHTLQAGTEIQRYPRELKLPGKIL